MEATTLMPAAFIGHESPMNTLETNRHTSAWRDLGRSLAKPRAVLAASAATCGEEPRATPGGAAPRSRDGAAREHQYLTEETAMTDTFTDTSDRARLFERAVSRWENEGGAVVEEPDPRSARRDGAPRRQRHHHDVLEARLVALRARKWAYLAQLSLTLET